MRNMIHGMLDLVYPRTCIGCGCRVSTGLEYFCWDCLSGMVLIAEPYCDVCGDPVDGKVEGRYTCSWCVKHQPAFDGARSAARYRGELRDALQSFKYEDATWLAGDFATMLRGVVRAHFSDVLLDGVVYVPLHTSRERERTYNQARCLASAVARGLRIPVFRDALVRTQATASQTTLHAAQRRQNIRGVFAVKSPGWIEGRRLLLVDDIMTTGATLDECSRMLKQAGAVSVHAVTVARG